MKQVYIYGGLDTRPTEIVRNFGMIWAVGGWLLFPFLQKIGAGRRRAAARAGRRPSSRPPSPATTPESCRCKEALTLDNIAIYNKRATGEKFLIDPSKGSTIVDDGKGKSRCGHQACRGRLGSVPEVGTLFGGGERFRARAGAGSGAQPGHDA